MPDVKAYLVSDATALTGVEVDDDLMQVLPAGEYSLTLDTTPTVTIPALTAGSIVQTSPTVGDTLTVTGSNAPANAVFNWQIGGVDLSPAVTTATLNTTGRAAGDYRRGVAITGVQAMVYTAPVTVAAAPVSGVTIAPTTTSLVPTNSTTTPQFTVNVSGYAAGDKLILFRGIAQVATSVTVNGKAAIIRDTFDPGTDRSSALADYTLDSADIAAGLVNVVWTLPASNSRHAMAALHAPAGSIVTPVQKVSGPTSQSVTPTNATNSVVSIIYGVSGRFSGTSGVVYTGGVVSRAQHVFSANAGVAVGIVNNAPTSGITVTATSDGTGNWAGLLFVVQ